MDRLESEGNVRADIPNDTDAALLDRLLAGEEAAFRALVAAYHNSLLRLAHTFVSDHGAAEEVVQETWLGVLKGLETFERRASLKTWIFRILVNRARTRGSRDGRTVNFSAMEDPAADRADFLDRFSADGRWMQPPTLWREQNPEEVLLSAETAACLHRAIAALPPAQRAVIIMRDVEGLESPDVCNILGVTETNQRVLLHRARTRVRALLEAHLQRG